MVDITYVCGNERLIDRIKNLWEELISHLLRVSPYFKEYYQTLTFEDRKRVILQRTNGGEVRVDLAFGAGELVGYCVSSIDRLLTGEVDSIFVKTHFRGRGIGRTLIEKVVVWLDGVGAKKNIVSVTVGNEQVYGFYKRFGFLPRRTLLEKKKNRNVCFL